MIDVHLHSYLSADTKEEPENFYKAASGFEFFCVSDHVNPLYFNPDFEGVTDFKAFFELYENLRKKYDAPAAIGIELGYTGKASALNKKIAVAHPFEIIINSVHEVDGRDCYFPEYFIGKSLKYAYTEYFKAVDKSLGAPYDFSVLGHLAYLERNAPYDDRAVVYKDYGDLLDGILIKLIKRNSCMEINTSSASATTPFLPNAEILARYYSLGGRLVSYGSDAHTAKNIGRKYDVAVSAARSAGFKNWSVRLLKDAGGFRRGINEFGF